MADIFISLTKTPNLEEQSPSPFFTTKWQNVMITNQDSIMLSKQTNVIYNRKKLTSW